MTTTFILVCLPAHAQKKGGILKRYLIGVLKQASSSRSEVQSEKRHTGLTQAQSLRGQISVHLAIAVAAKGLRDGDTRILHADVDLDFVPVRGTSSNLASFRVVALVHPSSIQPANNSDSTVPPALENHT